MPKRSRSYRKRPRTAKRRRVTRRRGVKGLSIQRNPLASRSQLVRMKYAEHVSINPVAGFAGVYTFRANSINDPNFTAAGHQPMSHDEWANFYDHYVVVGSKIKVTSLALSAGNGKLLGIHLSTETSASTNIIALLERGNTSLRLMNSGGYRLPTTTKGFSPKRHFGIKDIADNKHDVGANFGTNPTEAAYFHVLYADTDATTDLASADFLVEIEYTVMLSERKPVNQS